MKKNISVNLFGQLYSIDEDAYQLLDKYLNNIKRYFSSRDGGEEIADDIEHRVAELLSELKNSGVEAVSIEDVQSIIKRIGNPEQMDDDTADNNNVHNDNDEIPGNSDNDTGNAEKEHNKRKLYRDTDNQVIAGVLSGISAYFGSNNPLPWRLIFVIIAIATQIIPFFIIYLIMWAIIPEAVTPEERLKMKGRPVNIDTLNEELMNEPNRKKNPNNGIFATLITIIGFCLKIFFGIIIGVILCVLLITACGLLFGLITPFDITGFRDEADAIMNSFLAVNSHVIAYMWISVITAIIFASLILYSIIHSIVKRNSGNKMSSASRITLVLITIISLIVSIGSGILTYNDIDAAVEKHEHKTHTVNGIYLSGNQHRRLSQNGWQLMTYENASDDIYKRVRNLFDDDKRDLCFAFRRAEASKPMLVNLVRTEVFPAGDYHIEAIATSKCNGAYVYAATDSIVKTSKMIPVDDAFDKGNIQNMSNNELRNTVFFNMPASSDIWTDDDFREAADYWSYVRSESFHHDGGPLKCGVTNMNSVIGLSDSSVPAWNFNLRLIKIVADNN